MKKAIVLLFLLLQYSGVSAQDYNCVFLNSAFSEIQKRGKDYLIYSDVMRNKAREYKEQKKVIKYSDIKAEVTDSLTKCCNHASFFDDSLFHLQKPIFLIDTFNFFSDQCSHVTNYKMTITNNFTNLHTNYDDYDVVLLQSIRVYRSYFIITLKHYKSEQSVDFKFNIIAGMRPKLIAVERWYLE